MSDRSRSYGLASLAACALLLSACDRPFREVEPPSIEVIEPDLSEVQPSPTLVVSVSTESFRGVDRLEIDGRIAAFDSTTGLWKDTLQLDFGLNTFVLRAFDPGGAVRVDTAHAVHVGLSDAASLDALPAPRGGHAATRLPDGRILVTGGAERASGAARSDAYLVSPPFSFFTLPEGLRSSRVGHTASLLPDGRVLVLGGSRQGEVMELADLVETAEVFDPISNEFTEVPLLGDPIRRAYHTAAVYREGDEIVVDLYGGIGDISFGGGGRLGTRRDVRSFRFSGDSLYERTSQVGSVLLDPLAGHTQTSMTDAETRSEEQTLIVGSLFAGTGSETISLVLDYTRPGRFLDIEDVSAIDVPRTQHAAASLRRGTVLIVGGRQSSPGALVGRAELYIHETRRFFRFPEGSFGRSRFGHTATKLLDGRILLMGGFGSSGEALSDVSVVTARI